MTEPIAGTSWVRGGHGIAGGCFSLAWHADGEFVQVKSEDAERGICCAATVPFEALLALYAERPRFGASTGAALAIERLCFEAANAADFEADEGALMRELAPLAHSEITEMRLWKQRCLNAEEELRRLRGEQHAPSPDYAISDAKNFVAEHEDGEEP